MRPIHNTLITFLITLFIIQTNSRFLHNSLKNLSLSQVPSNSPQQLSFLSSYLNKAPHKKGWHYLGDRPAHDIKYKKLIAQSFKDIFFLLYKNLMDDYRIVKLIFGKTKRLHNITNLKLVFVVKLHNQNKAYIGVELRYKGRKFHCDSKEVEVVRFGKSTNCKDVLRLMHIDLKEFKFGPSVEFLNSSKAGMNLWKNMPMSDRNVYSKDLNELIKVYILEFNAWLVKSGILSINTNLSGPKNHALHHITTSEVKHPVNNTLVNIGSAYVSDTELDG
jgi:hypothetical protein